MDTRPTQTEPIIFGRGASFASINYMMDMLLEELRLK